MKQVLTKTIIYTINIRLFATCNEADKQVPQIKTIENSSVSNDNQKVTFEWKNLIDTSKYAVTYIQLNFESTHDEK
jgi:hypothetical protein